MQVVMDDTVENVRRKDGALVISLDFELHWGVRDRVSDPTSYLPNLLGARAAIPRLLDLFEEFEISATWATVGFLFAESKCELEQHFPRIRPQYLNQTLNAYQQAIGDGEDEDPLHYAPSLISMIARRPRQEIGTHTFSHYYCLEKGQSRETFAADLEQAIAIARRRGISVRSIVFPRNQINPEYLDVLSTYGISSYRGTEHGWMYTARAREAEQLTRRAARIIDQYCRVAGKKTWSWTDLPGRDGLCNVRASMFLRPYSPRLAGLDRYRYARISHCLRAAAVNREVFHLWWHPHNFGRYLDENLRFLRSVLEEFKRLQQAYGVRSLCMCDVSNEATAETRTRDGIATHT